MYARPHKVLYSTLISSSWASLAPWSGRFQLPRIRTRPEWEVKKAKKNSTSYHFRCFISHYCETKRADCSVQYGVSALFDTNLHVYNYFLYVPVELLVLVHHQSGQKFNSIGDCCSILQGHGKIRESGKKKATNVDVVVLWCKMARHRFDYQTTKRNAAPIENNRSKYKLKRGRLSIKSARDNRTNE